VSSSPCTTDIVQDHQSNECTRGSSAQVLPFPGSPEPLSPWERAIALATIDLVAAYRHLQGIEYELLPPAAKAPFELACFGMCSTLDAVDVLGATVWDV
jgi:hypothetical protein